MAQAQDLIRAVAPIATKGKNWLGAWGRTSPALGPYLVFAERGQLGRV